MVITDNSQYAWYSPGFYPKYTVAISSIEDPNFLLILGYINENIEFVTLEGIKISLENMRLIMEYMESLR